MNGHQFEVNIFDYANKGKKKTVFVFARNFGILAMPKATQDVRSTFRFGSKIRSRKIEKCLIQLEQALR